MTRTRLLSIALLVLASMLALATPCRAKVLKTRRANRPPGVLEFTVGAALEFQTDVEATEYGLPLLLEWSPRPMLTLTAEPTFVSILPKASAAIHGLDDLDSAIEWEFVSERRTRPAVALQGEIKWPTTTHLAIGDRRREFGLGVLVSKELVPANFSLNVIAGRSARPSLGQVRDIVQISAAAEWHLNPDLDLQAELLTTQGFGPLRGPIDPRNPNAEPLNVPGRGTGEVEATLGLAQLFGKRLKLEEAAIVQTDGTWQAIVAWEWDFGGGR